MSKPFSKGDIALDTASGLIFWPDAVRMYPSDPPSEDLSFTLEKLDEQHYRVPIKASQLERFAETLRGKRKFSIFYSITLPALAAAAAFVVPGTVQHLGQKNSNLNQMATNREQKAFKAYENAAIAIGQRNQTTYAYLSAARNLTIKRSDSDSDLSKATLEIDRQTLKDYAAMLQSWNEKYSLLLSEIDYDLDRPVFEASEKPYDGNPVRAALTNQVKCNLSITEQMADVKITDPRLGIVKMDKHSLKNQFAVIRHCFDLATASLDIQRNSAAVINLATMDENVRKKATDGLDNLLSTANIFRCYARQRIEYYTAEIQFAVLSPRTLYQNTPSGNKRRAIEYLKLEDLRCGLS